MYEIRIRSFFSLKAIILVGFVLIWNSYFLGVNYAVHENFFRLGPFTREKMLALLPLYGLSALGAFSIAISESIQRKVVAPSRSDNFRSREFYFLGILLSVFAVVFSLGGLGIISLGSRVI